MSGRIRVALAAIGAAAALAPAGALAPAAASAAIGSPTVTLTPSSAPAGSTANLGMDLKFAPTGGDSVKDMTLTLPAGLLANASIDGGACLASLTPKSACQVGSGTVTADPVTFGITMPVPISVPVTFDLVGPPAAGDLAGLALLANGSQLGSPAAITIRPATDPAGLGLNLAFAGIPDTYQGTSISIQEINSTFDSLRFPDSCPATPAIVGVSADSYDDSTAQTGSAPLTATGCSALPFSPGFAVSVTRDSADNFVSITTDITQTASQATSRSVSLGFPSAVLSPNLGVVSVLCANPSSGTCTAVGSATAVSPLYPSPLNGQAYLTGSFTAPTLTLVFPAPFSLSLTGQINLANNSTTFSGIPDFPLTDLRVTLNGGSHAVFESSCHTTSGVATAALTSQNGDENTTVSTPFTVGGCGTLVAGSGDAGTPPAGGKPQIHAASLSGLTKGKPALLFQLVAGKNAPKLSSFTVKLPAGLSFVRHRVHKVLKLLGLSLTGAKVRSAVLRHGQLIVTLRRSVESLIFSLSDRGLRESRSLRSRAAHGKLKSLKLTVIVGNAAGRSTTLTLTLR